MSAVHRLLSIVWQKLILFDELVVVVRHAPADIAEAIVGWAVSAQTPCYGHCRCSTLSLRVIVSNGSCFCVCVTVRAATFLYLLHTDLFGGTTLLQEGTLAAPASGAYVEIDTMGGKTSFAYPKQQGDPIK